MDINIKVTNITLTPDISDYLDKRLQSFKKYIDPEDTSVLLTVEVGKTTDHHQSGDIFRAEINLHISGHDFRAVSEQETLYSAIDDVKSEMTQELRRHKRKRLHLMRRGGVKVKEFIRGVAGRVRRRKK
ncbi:ribosome-associated translation inhibitor RaiA [Patescibacteria group bacterium]|nr:ribosome-associated translation inhibitor RaiA [Patescibacteria group bacterium]